MLYQLWCIVNNNTFPKRNKIQHHFNWIVTRQEKDREGQEKRTEIDICLLLLDLSVQCGPSGDIDRTQSLVPDNNQFVVLCSADSCNVVINIIGQYLGLKVDIRLFIFKGYKMVKVNVLEEPYQFKF